MLARIKAAWFSDPAQARLGHDRFYAGESSLSQVSSALAGGGLFSGRRLVTFADAERAGRAGAADRRELVELLQRNLGGTVFAAMTDLPLREVERKNELCRALLGACVVVDLARPTPAEAMRWLLEECRRRGIGLEAEAGAYLMSRIGPDLQELSRELEKLELTSRPGEKIGEAEIREMVRRGQLGNGWELCEAVLGNRTVAALRLWDAVQNTEPVLRTQWLLQRQARTRLLRSSGTAEEDRLGRIVLASYDLERGIKTGRIPAGHDGTALELLVASLGAGRTRTKGGARTHD